MTWTRGVSALAAALLLAAAVAVTGAPGANAVGGELEVTARAELVAADPASGTDAVARAELLLTTTAERLTDVAVAAGGSEDGLPAEALVCADSPLAAGSPLTCAAELAADAEHVQDCTLEVDLVVSATRTDGSTVTTAVVESLALEGCAADGPAPSPTPGATTEPVPSADPTPAPTAPEPSPQPPTPSVPGDEPAEPRDETAAPRTSEDGTRSSTRALSPIEVKYQSTGGAKGPLGKQVGAERTTTSGRWAAYEHGRIYWSSSTGAHTIIGAMLNKFVGGGSTGSFGFPQHDERCGLPGGGCYQSFQRRQIHWSPATGAHWTHGGIRSAWGRAGYERGKLGYPTTDERCGLVRSGCYQSFQGGSVHWSPATGAHWSTGGIRREWGSYGWERGILGYPTSDERCNDGGCWQYFQYGKVEYKPGRGTWATPAFRPVVKTTTRAEVEHTYRSGCPVGPSSLRTITMTHWDYSGRAQRGVLIVRSSLVDGVVDAFEEAYQKRYRINRMDNPNEWRGDDPDMMYANNTSGFNCRSVVGNPYAVSPHSYGIAVDINTVQNPYRDARGKWWPSNGTKYILGGGLNRPKEHPAIHRTDTTMVRALEKRGWFWGGRWASRDYHHFEKN